MVKGRRATWSWNTQEGEEERMVFARKIAPVVIEGEGVARR